MTGRFYIRVTAIAASAFGTAFAAIAIADPLPRVIWNASASAPLGLYRIEPDRDPARGALVAVAPSKPLARWMTARGYLGRHVPLLKHVAAKPGQRVSRKREPAPVQVLGFTLDELKEARLAPVVDFKGRRAKEGNGEQPGPGELEQRNEP